MRQILSWVQQFDRKRLFLSAAALLLVLNLGRMAHNYYQGQLQEVSSKKDLLEQYISSVEKLPDLKNRVSRLEQRSTYLEKYLFLGGNLDDISSAIQITMQKMVTNAGLTPESIRPIKSGKAGAVNSNYNMMMINLRLSGTLPQYLKFYSQLYKSRKLFLVESLTLRSYKDDILKSYFVIQAYYKINPNFS